MLFRVTLSDKASELNCPVQHKSEKELLYQHLVSRMMILKPNSIPSILLLGNKVYVYITVHYMQLMFLISVCTLFSCISVSVFPDFIIIIIINSVISVKCMFFV